MSENQTNEILVYCDVVVSDDTEELHSVTLKHSN